MKISKKNILTVCFIILILYIGSVVTRVNEGKNNEESSTWLSNNIVATTWNSTGLSDTIDEFDFKNYLISAKSDARDLCHQLISKLLKSPEASNFAPIAETRIIASDEDEIVKELFPKDEHNKYTFALISYVDAPNSFGQTLRTDIACLFEYDNKTKDSIIKNMMSSEK